MLERGQRIKFASSDWVTFCDLLINDKKEAQNLTRKFGQRCQILTLAPASRQTHALPDADDSLTLTMCSGCVSRYMPSGRVRLEPLNRFALQRRSIVAPSLRTRHSCENLQSTCPSLRFFIAIRGMMHTESLHCALYTVSALKSFCPEI